MVFQKTHSLFKVILRPNESQQKPHFDIFQELFFFNIASSTNLILKDAPFDGEQY